MLIIDAHLDLAINALQRNRNLLQSAYTIRISEFGRPGKGMAQGTVALPEMRQGRVALAFVTLVARSTGRVVHHIDYATPFQAYAITRGQLAYYRALEREGYARIITDRTGLDRHLAEWTAWDAAAGTEIAEPPPLGFVISMEGADSILNPDQLAQWRQAGLRLLGLTHFGPGRYAGGNGTELGLTELGRRLLAEMARLGILLDLTHCSDQSFWEALDHYHGPVLASHSNARALVPNQRQFSDAQLEAIIARDGVIGVLFGCSDLVPGWIVGARHNGQVTLQAVVDQIDYICRLAGDTRHVAIGTDLDGGVGRDEFPREIDTIADLQRLPALLAARGYSSDDIAAILHGNWLRFLRQAWPNDKVDQQGEAALC